MRNEIKKDFCSPPALSFTQPIPVIYINGLLRYKNLPYLIVSNKPGCREKSYQHPAALPCRQICCSTGSKRKVERACLDYIEGFYEGDTTKLIRSIKPSLCKFGYWKNDKSGKYEAEGNMTIRQALDYAKGVFEKKNFAKQESPKKVEVLDIMNSIAVAKVTAWWGTDYILLAKQDEKWMIEQVLWEGPLQK